MKKKKFLKELKKTENFELVLDVVLKELKKSINILGGVSFTTQETVKKYLMINFKASVNELFSCLFLDNKHKLIAYEELFRGTINQTQVYPRVVVQRALFHNAASVILAHNHPSLNLQPSESDKEITRKLIDILAVVDIRVLDHFIVSPYDTFSMAQNGHM
ncbi:MAG: JAB domain-containing protein [Flavobacteriaceae bacterium]